jgi:hypothetical protein
MRKIRVVAAAAIALSLSVAALAYDVEVISAEEAFEQFTVDQMADAGFIESHQIIVNQYPETFVVARMPETPGAEYPLALVATLDTDIALPLGGAAGHSTALGVRPEQT